MSDEQPKDDAKEHPAARAARMIKDLHQQNIDMIDGGHVFERDGVDVSQQIREASVAQLAVCDDIIARADSMPEQFTLQAAEIAEQIEEITKPKSETEVQDLLEIGNYDHKEIE